MKTRDCFVSDAHLPPCKFDDQRGVNSVGRGCNRATMDVRLGEGDDGPTTAERALGTSRGGDRMSRVSFAAKEPSRILLVCHTGFEPQPASIPTWKACP